MTVRTATDSELMEALKQRAKAVHEVRNRSSYFYRNSMTAMLGGYALLSIAATSLLVLTALHKDDPTTWHVLIVVGTLGLFFTLGGAAAMAHDTRAAVLRALTWVTGIGTMTLLIWFVILAPLLRG